MSMNKGPEELLEAIKEWELAYAQIDQQAQHSWLLKGIQPLQADEAIEQVWETIEQLQDLADRLESQAERANGLLP